MRICEYPTEGLGQGYPLEIRPSYKLENSVSQRPCSLSEKAKEKIGRSNTPVTLPAKNKPQSPLRLFIFLRCEGK